MSDSNKLNSNEQTKHEKAKVMVVDDNVDLLKLMSIRLRPFNFELKTVTSAEEALSTLAVWPADLVITDLQMEGMSGMELFQQLQRDNPMLPVIILTAHGTIPEAVEATESGVASYLTKPFDSDVLVEKIRVALHNSGFTEEQTKSTPALVYDKTWRNKIASKSSVMRTLLSHIEKIAPSDALVLLEGEPGVGKNSVARALHLRSARAHNGFAHLSCSAFRSKTLTAELFGVEEDLSRGVDHREGLIEETQGGTILLSDFTEASPQFFADILHCLVRKKASPINSTSEYPVDVRIIATTSSTDGYGQDDGELAQLGNKVDLTRLTVPALRDRIEDIPLVVNDWLNKNTSENEAQFSAAAMQLLMSTEWPGNISHLLNVVQQCVKLSTTKIISDTLVASRLDSPILKVLPLTNAHREFERDYLTKVLKVTRGNVTQASQLAKRNRTEFHRLLKKHRIDAKEYRNNK